jgi:hypothetical protein
MLCFVPSRRSVYLICTVVGLLVITACSAQQPSRDAPFEVEKHMVFDLLDRQHLGNLIYRPNDEDGEFIAWGRLPLQQWPYGSSSQNQLVSETDEVQYADQGTTGEEEVRYTNGGDVLDVDGDGAMEVIVGRGTGESTADSRLYWFDPQGDGEEWQEHYIADTGDGGYVAPHDVQAYTTELPSGEEVRGVVGNIGRTDVFFLEVPDDPTEPWIRYDIGSFENDDHSGMVIVDVNGDGNKDIVTGMYWIEGPDDPRQEDWVFHRYGTWDQSNEGWGGMAKHGVADFDDDGQVEIVASEAEIPGARLSLFERRSEDGTGEWEETPIDEDLYAPHSLVVGDLNADGQQDFVVGEMTAAGWSFPLNPNPKIYGYVNRGDTFERYTIDEGWGVHEMRTLPERRDGNLVLYAADEIQPQKFDGMETPLNIWLIAPK